MVEIGSPTSTPKSRGKSNGWEKGRKRNKAKVYPTIKKRQSKNKKGKKT
ncbi:hypothetical protein GM3709_1120 [Geminocystis sp. NIES-3709]|nr:hypothetical protein GM3709_1120 [Geminocystis sp. NIES-3709]